MQDRQYCVDKMPMGNDIPVVATVDHEILDPYPSVAMLKEIASIATLSALTFYAAGLIVTNCYLASIGLTDYGSLKPRCVMTGAWACVAIFLCSMPALVFRRIMLSPPGHDLRKGKLSEMERVSTLCLVIFLGLFAVLSGKPIPSLNELLNFFILVCICSMPILFDVLFIKTAMKHLPDSMSSRLKDARIRTAIVGIICYAGVLFLIAVLFYPVVLPTWGGGEPQRARLVLNYDGATVWRKLPADKNGTGAQPGAMLSQKEDEPFLTPEVEILYVTDGELVLRVQQQRDYSVFTLDRKLVSALIPR